MSSMREVFALEVIKLLLQAAWADHEVAPEEAEHLMAHARQAGMTEEHLAELRSYLSGDEPLPPPNLGLLKQRRVEVLREVKRLLQSDAEVAPEENTILEQISLLLR